VGFGVQRGVFTWWCGCEGRLGWWPAGLVVVR